MAALLDGLATSDGITRSCLDGVHFGRLTHSHPRTPVLYEPNVYIVARGRKIGFIGNRTVTYDANNYLVLAAPLPFDCQTEPGPDGPMLGLSVRVTPALVSDLAARMPLEHAVRPAGGCDCVEATPLELPMSDAAIRLLECLSRPVDADILGPGIVREVVYRALCGPQGHVLLGMIGRQGQTAQINTALRWMHARYAEPFSVGQIAGEVGMSVSAFHHRFKAATASSPVQYLKSVRLHKARDLIVNDGAGAAEAALSVGYESASQFSREFKRFFGTTPSDEARRLRALVTGASSAATHVAP
jgi:AraC-like DNA-binding protein